MDNLEIKKQEALETDNPQTGDDLSEKEKRYKEQLAGSKKEAERLKNLVIEAEYQKASQDANSLLELHTKDPKLANDVAKKFGYTDFDDLQSQNTTVDQSEKSNNGLTEDDFERMYQKRKKKEEHEKAIKKASKVINKLDESLQEKAQAYFDKLSDGRTLDEDTALEFAEMTTLYVNRDKIKGDKYQEGLGLLGSTGLSNSKKVTEQQEEYVVRDGKLILKPNK